MTTADLIDRAELLKDLEEVYHNSGTAHVVVRQFIRYVKRRPFVDAEKIVRCYECAQSERMQAPLGTVVHCHHWHKDVDYNGFCYEGY